MALRSWVQVDTFSHFPIQNLPYGIFSTVQHPKPRAGVAIGEFVLDLAAASRLAPLSRTKAAQASAFHQGSLNEFMSLGREAWQEARSAITHLLSKENCALSDNATLRQEILVPMKEVKMHLPAQIGDYTDFYCCQEHAKNAAAIKTGVRVLSPNWLHLPVAYHSRSSSIVLSGSAIRRPWGQVAIAPQGNLLTKFINSWWATLYPQSEAKPTAAMDYELEMACFIGVGNELGKAVQVDEAGANIFGMVLMNDWSARDFQKFEMFPLGPFNSKNFATTISPWIVTMDALEEFKKPAPLQNPPVKAYLQEKNRSLYDINLSASIQPKENAPSIVSKSNFQELYWTPQQMITHHTLGGCNLRPGDLLGTGTISSPGAGGQGCLLELSWGGTRDVNLERGQTRRYLQDGDTVTLSGYCQAQGYRIGFGDCTGTILPARSQDLMH